MKTCFKCNTQKPYSEFYRHPRMADGYLGKCKECTKNDVRENRSDKNEYYREFDRNRANLPHRVEARRKYQMTETGKSVCRRSKAKYVHMNPDRRDAHTQLSNAIRSGLVKKPCACWFCGSRRRIEGHHADYSNALGVTWLCKKCHTRVHQETKMYNKEMGVT